MLHSVHKAVVAEKCVRNEPQNVMRVRMLSKLPYTLLIASLSLDRLGISADVCQLLTCQ